MPICVDAVTVDQMLFSHFHRSPSGGNTDCAQHVQFCHKNEEQFIPKYVQESNFADIKEIEMGGDKKTMKFDGEIYEKRPRQKM